MVSYGISLFICVFAMLFALLLAGLLLGGFTTEGTAITYGLLTGGLDFRSGFVM